MARAGTIDVDIRANSAQFVRSMQAVQKSTQRVSRQLTTFARSATAAFAAFGGASAARNVARTADELQNFANRIGESASELQAWQLIAERFNVQNNQLNTGLQRFQRRAAEAAVGTGEAQEALRELGIDAQRITRIGLDDQILTLASAFEQVSSDADRTRLAFKLFDSEGVAFLQFLNQGQQGLIALRKELEGQIWSDEEIARLSELNTTLVELSQTLLLQFGPIIAGTVGGISEFITRASEGLTQFVRLVTATFGNEQVAAIAEGKLSGAGATGVSAEGQDVSITGGGQDFSAAIEEAKSRAIILAEVSKQERQRIQDQERQEFLDRWDAVSGRFENLFTQNLVQAADGSFDSILQSWTRTLQQMFAQLVASQIFDFIGGALAPAGGGSGPGFLRSLFGRASGGPVSPGQPYMVGERGPEVFVPNGAGNIVPNGGGMMINVDARGSTLTPRQVTEAVQAGVAASEARVFDRMRRR